MITTYRIVFTAPDGSRIDVSLHGTLSDAVDYATSSLEVCKYHNRARVCTASWSDIMTLTKDGRERSSAGLIVRPALALA